MEFEDRHLRPRTETDPGSRTSLHADATMDVKVGPPDVAEAGFVLLAAQPR